MAEFPQRQIQLVVCPEALGNNRKVSNLVQMLALAQYDHILINDSDIHVRPDYLRRVMAPFVRPEVGMVTCPYRGIAANTLGSKLESLGISTDFIPGVLVARQIEHGIHFALGSTLAASRKALNAIGGLEPLVDYLADDFELGFRIARQVLMWCWPMLWWKPICPPIPSDEFFEHQLRWARTTRDSRRMGYLGLLLTFGLPWAMIAVPLLARLVELDCACAGCLMRAAVALQVGVGVVQDRPVVSNLWLLPLRDLVAFCVWFASFANHKVQWRGEVFLLENGRIRPAILGKKILTAAKPEEDKVSVHLVSTSLPPHFASTHPFAALK